MRKVKDFLKTTILGGLFVLLPVILPLALGVIIGSPLGVMLGEKLSAQKITIIFLAMTTLVIIEKIIAIAL